MGADKIHLHRGRMLTKEAGKNQLIMEKLNMKKTCVLKVQPSKNVSRRDKCISTVNNRYYNHRKKLSRSN